MKRQFRLDKYLADMGIGTRSEVKIYIRKALVKVNHQVCRDVNIKVDIDKDIVEYKDEVISYVLTEYFMLNKPGGVISATEDKFNETVVDLIKSSKRKDLFPVGRLDKDTEGLLLLTNDGDMAHDLLSPKKHINKVYYARIDGRVTNEDVITFKQGVTLEDGYETMPADLTILRSDETSEIELTIYEGKFHQVKRMFEAIGKEVTYLRRLSMGPLELDKNLQLGEYRALTADEINLLKNVGK